MFPGNQYLMLVQ